MPESYLDQTTLTLGLAAGEDVAGPLAYLNADQRGIGSAANGKPSLTIDEAGAWLTMGEDSRWVDTIANSPGEPGWGGVRGQAFTVTYAFRSTAPAEMPSDTGGFARFNAAQITQAELAMKAWSDVANITFVRDGSGTVGEQAYSDDAAILLGNYRTGADGAAAFAMLPWDTDPASIAGDVWINSSLSYNAAPTVGNYGGQVLVHELGHAIGLTHPGAYDADANLTFTYAADAEYYEDSRQYTVMSYFSESNTGASYQGRYAAAPQLDDIRAAQVEYGANMTTRTGDTTYGFNSNADRPWFITNGASQKLIFAVWDAGGRDTFDFSSYTNNQTIDLRAGYFSNVGGLTGNVAIAEGVTIENALGGSGADTIHGNDAANQLLSGAGADSVAGGAGADTILDTAGSNYLRGEDGDDQIIGGSGFDDMNGNAGADALYGGAGDDWVVGGKDNDNLDGGAGNDIVYGNLGDDWCDGGAGNDLIRGGQGNDILIGRDGADWLSGDRGADTLYGGTGADTFHGSADAGLDLVMDFNYAEGDRITFDAGTTYTVDQVGLDVVITMSPGNQMILEAVSLSSFGPGWIV